jgi:pimeloyl-ACP methyl ester carboxylesterase
MVIPMALRRPRTAHSYAKSSRANAMHRIIKGIGHNLPQEAPQAFTEAVIEVEVIDRR